MDTHDSASTNDSRPATQNSTHVSPAANAQVPADFHGLRPATPQERAEDPSPPPLVPPQTHLVPREKARARIAYGLVSLLAAEIAGAGAMAWTGRVSMADLKDLIAVLFVPTLGLVGTVIGFYYSSGG